MNKTVALALIAGILAAPAVVRAEPVVLLHEEKIILGGEHLLTLRDEDPVQAQMRSDALYQRLSRLGNTFTPADIKICDRGGERCIEINGQLLVTVTSYDAMLNNTSVDGLAQVWRQRLAGTYREILHPSPVMDSNRQISQAEPAPSP